VSGMLMRTGEGDALGNGLGVVRGWGCGCV